MGFEVYPQEDNYNLPRDVDGRIIKKMGHAALFKQDDKL